MTNQYFFFILGKSSPSDFNLSGRLSPGDLNITGKLSPKCPYFIPAYNIDSNSIFPPEIRAEFKTKMNRITNSYEWFRSRLNGIFLSSNPNIYNFIDVQIDTRIEVRIDTGTIRKSNRFVAWIHTKCLS